MPIYPECLDGGGSVGEGVGRLSQHMGVPSALDDVPVGLWGKGGWAEAWEEREIMGRRP